MEDILISCCRKILLEQLRNCKSEAVLLYINEIPVEKIVFEKRYDGSLRFCKELLPVLEKINFSNVSFDNFYCSYVDFSKYKGIKINPQTVYKKCLSFSTLKGVTIVGSFDGVYIIGSNFKGTKGIKINPQTVYKKNLSFSTLEGVEFIGPFDNTHIDGADFTGSKGKFVKQLKKNYNKYL